MLHLEGLSCGYGLFRAVSELDLKVPHGTITGLIGLARAGKPATVMRVAGHVDLQAGRIVFDDHDIGGLPATERVRRGIAIAPEGRRLFKDLSVEDNLRVGGLIHAASLFKADREYVLSLFPRLGERLGSLAATLSGGEQQMLSIGRALMARPKLIMIDELSLGLMPKMVDLCYDALLRLKRDGMTILLVEQNTDRVLAVADHVCVLESGRTVWSGSAADARKDPELAAAYLGLR